jgi:polar amino acid transport system substrate-binding protein
MKLIHIVFVILLSAGTAFAVGKYVAAPTGQPQQTKETRFDQIKRTGVLRCGYYVWPPFIDKDLSTGKMKGLFPDIMEEIGKQLSLKIEWTTEIVHPQIPTDLASGRYDAVCGILFATPSRAREMDFTMPLLFHPAYLVARADDTRFDNNYEAANNPSIKFATLEGEYSSIAANEQFPKAQKVALPQNSNGSELLLNLANGKADLVITEKLTFLLYDKGNPGKLRIVAGPPESVIAAGFPVPQNEPALKNVLDTTMLYLHNTGIIDKLFKKFETPDNKLFRMTQPYVTSEKGE